MANTTNFGWETPDDTDLVKDGAAAIRTLGSAIDTSLVDLKGGTTGQVLAKASNTDMDFTWASDATGIQATIFDAKGDLIAASAADTAARLAVGANGSVLTADSSEASGLKWATPTAAGTSWSLVSTAATTSGSTVTISSITGADKLLVVINDVSTGSAGQAIYLRINSTSANYYVYGADYYFGSTYAAANFSTAGASDRIPLALQSGSANSAVSGYCIITGGNASGVKVFNAVGASTPAGNNQQQHTFTGGYWNDSSTISSISIVSAGTFDAGSISVYKSA